MQAPGIGMAGRWGGDRAAFGNSQGSPAENFKLRPVGTTRWGQKWEHPRRGGRPGAAGIRTGLVSNSMAAGREDGSTFPEMYDGVVISAGVGLHKPQPEIFLLGAERAGVPAEECVFVDDLRENCEGAEAVPENEQARFPHHSVTPGYFAAMGIPLKEGRAFRTQDDSALRGSAGSRGSYRSMASRMAWRICSVASGSRRQSAPTSGRP